MRYCGWGDDWVLRLFKRGSGEFSPDLVHERLIVQGTSVELEGTFKRPRDHTGQCQVRVE